MSGPRKVYRELQNGPATLNDVAEAIGVPAKRVATWLARAERYGMVRRERKVPAKHRPLTVWAAL